MRQRIARRRSQLLWPVFLALSCERIIFEPEPAERELRFVAVSAGAAHTCALTTKGEVYCWGLGRLGALGTDSLTSALVPVRVAGDLSFAALSAGANHTCALTGAGEAYCWGRGDRGQVGTGASADSPTPLAVAGGITFSAISAGGEHTCGIGLAPDTASGTAASPALLCWGRGENGELGNASLADMARPARVGVALPYAAVRAGQHHACALTEDGDALCWGWNPSGQLGVGHTIGLWLPEPVVGGLRFTALSAGYEHTCGLTVDGRAYCWGRGDFGQLGTGRPEDALEPSAGAGDPAFASVSAGMTHTCALTVEGRAYCWGSNGEGRLGSGDDLPLIRPQPGPVAGGLRFVQLSAGAQHTCGVTDDATIYCWGAGGLGQLGNGSVANRSAPTQIREPAQPADGTSS